MNNDSDDLSQFSDMREYVLVFLRKAYASKNDIADLQNDHLSYLNDLMQSGKLLLTGPLADDNDIKAICIYKCSLNETIQFAQEDPAVKSGNLVFEIHRWLGDNKLLMLAKLSSALQYQ